MRDRGKHAREDGRDWDKEEGEGESQESLTEGKIGRNRWRMENRRVEMKESKTTKKSSSYLLYHNILLMLQWKMSVVCAYVIQLPLHVFYIQHYVFHSVDY